MSRRDLLRAGAATSVVAVPTVGLGRNVLAASSSGGAHHGVEEPALDPAEVAAVSAAGPLMVCVHDAAGGNVSILHGTEEIVLEDRRLVAKIVRAKSGAQPA
jgi:hypothetical protein